ncbi:hypothetical protein DR64_1616 [Paraburkholderia xenovorans LB400]|uniref:Uncharacterized protein n=1 Tax=Paraburkholderia xenovorans (strain LB400) TaxID=266265 RepID=Q145C9_PARXL|nr:hypothetical protein [Paraburkholderia xenovorans]ABE29060.1 hypothetical protein Bxe_A3939 [Paraburkholderia xenovorans LB400]AIP31114.1 hypothetical protein DR64_1616 [Paraburkholderia xenovorans LB400]
MAKTNKYKYVLNIQVDEPIYKKILARFEEENDENFSAFVRRIATKKISLDVEVYEKVTASLNEIGRQINSIVKDLHEKTEVTFITLEEFKIKKQELEVLLVFLDEWVNRRNKMVDFDFDGSEKIDRPAVKKRIYVMLSEQENHALMESMEKLCFNKKADFVRCLLSNSRSLYVPRWKAIFYAEIRIKNNLSQVKRHINEANLLHMSLLHEVSDIAKTLKQLRKNFDKGVEI